MGKSYGLKRLIKNNTELRKWSDFWYLDSLDGLRELAKFVKIMPNQSIKSFIHSEEYFKFGKDNIEINKHVKSRGVSTIKWIFLHHKFDFSVIKEIFYPNEDISYVSLFFLMLFHNSNKFEVDKILN